MAATFQVHGPFRIPLSGQNHRYLIPGCPEFWAQPGTGDLALECGCYLFAIRAAKGYRPVYVGKTTSTFEKECFAPHKVAYHYQRAISEMKKGTPVLFLVVLKRTKGRTNERAISQVESFLIQNALAKNPQLSNVRGTKEEKWSITGVIRGGKGKFSKSAAQLRKAVGL